MIDLTALVDSVTADLETHVTDLPADFTPWGYMPPHLLTADHAPWLAIYPQQARFEPIATGNPTLEITYENRVRLIVEWAEPATAGPEAGAEADLAAAHDGLVVAQQIANRLLAYGVGIPGIAEQLYGDLTNVTYGEEQAGAWKTTFEIEIREEVANA